MEIYAVIHQSETFLYKYDNFSKFGFFYKRNVKELADEYIKILSQRLAKFECGKLTRCDDIGIEGVVLYVYRQDNKSNTYIVCSHNVNRLIILNVLTRFFGLFDNNQRNNLLQEFNEHPEKFIDKIEQINEQLAQTKEILIDNIDKILDRGEHIDVLLQKSETLSMDSKEFAIRAKKLNSCCVLL